MRRIILISLCCIAPVFFTAYGYCADGPYLSVHLGASFLEDSDLSDSTLPGVDFELSFDTGWVGGIAGGYRLSDFRLEGEIWYGEHDVDETSVMGFNFDSTGDGSVTALLLNGYYDFNYDSPFIPFVCAGVGYAKVEVNDYNFTGSGMPNFSDDDSVFAYQLGVGVGYVINENFMIDLKYRYFATEDPEFGTLTTEIASHNFLLGARFNF